MGNGIDIAHLRLTVDAEGYLRAMDQVDKASDKAGRSAGKLADRIDRDLRRAMAAVATYFGARELIGYADAWSLIQGRIGLVTRSHEEAVVVMDRVFGIAQAARSDFSATADLYTSMARGAQTLGKTQNDVLTVTEAVAKAMVLSGASAQSSEAAIRQLGQAFGEGALRGDELVSIMGQAPAVAQMIADGMGVPIGQLRKLGAEGKLTADVVFEALQKQADVVEERFGKMPTTVGQAFTVLRNDMMRFVGTNDEASGASRALVAILMAVAKNLDTIIRVVGIAGAAWLGYRTAVIAAGVAQAAITSVEAIKKVWQLATAVEGVAKAGNKLDKNAYMQIAKLVLSLGGSAAAWWSFNKAQEAAEEEMANAAAAAVDLDQKLGNGAAAVRELTDEQKRAIEKAKEQRQANEDLVRAASQQAALAGLQGEAQERMRIQFNRVNQEIEARRELTGPLLAETLAAIQAEEQWALAGVTAAAALERQNKAMEEKKRKQDELLKEQERILENFEERVQGAFADTFYRIFTDGIRTFGDFIDSIKQMFFRMLSEMLAKEAMAKWGGALAGTLAGLFGGVPGAAAQSATMTGPITTGGGSATAVVIEGLTVTGQRDFLAALMPILAAGAAGFGVGSMVGGLTTNRAAGALGGAAAGAAIGSVLPGIGTAAGALVGGLAGLVGGFMGATRAAKAHREEMERIAQYRREFEHNVQLRQLEADGRRDEAALLALQHQHANELRQARKEEILTHGELTKLVKLQRAETEALMQAQRKAAEEERQRREQEKGAFVENMLLRSLRMAGLEAEADDLALVIAQQNEMREAIEKYRDGQSAVITHLRELHRLEREYRREQRRLAELAFTQELEIRRLSLLGLNERAAAMRLEIQQRREMEDARRQGFSPGALAQLASLHALERYAAEFQHQQEKLATTLEAGLADTIAALQEQTEIAREDLRVSEEQSRELARSVSETRKLVESLRQYADGLSLNAQLSTLSPTQRLEEAQRQYMALLGRARGGDAAAAGDLQGAASTYLDSARSVFASGGQYVEVFNQVRAGIEEVAGQFEGQLSVEERMLAALNDQIELLKAQINELQATRDQAQANTQKQIEEIRSGDQVGGALLRDLIERAEQQRDAALSIAAPVIDQLAQLKETTSGWSQAIVTELHASLSENRQAVIDSADAYIRALNEGKDWATVNGLKTIHELQVMRLEASTRAAAFIAQLIATGEIAREGNARMVESILENKKALDASVARYVAAVHAGADQQTLATLKAVAEVQGLKLDQNVHTAQIIAKFAEQGQLAREEIDVLQANRHAVLSARDEQIRAIEEGKSQAHIDTLDQIARLEQARFDSNANFYIQIAKLREMGVLDQETYDKIEQARSEADAAYIKQIAELKGQLTKQGEIKAAVDANGALIDALKALTVELRELLKAIDSNTWSISQTLKNDILGAINRPPHIRPIEQQFTDVLAENNRKADETITELKAQNATLRSLVAVQQAAATTNNDRLDSVVGALGDVDRRIKNLNLVQ